MRRSLVVGNWKLNGSRALVADLLGQLRDTLDGVAVECAVCPPFVYLESSRAALAGSAIAVGAQDVAAQAEGAYTGEVSAQMLADCGCRYALVGHSERRQLFGDSDAVVAGKLARALEAGVIPILCVGEGLEEREAGRTLAVVERQLRALDDLPDGVWARAVLAYEPVWAIGTGRTASPAQAQEVHAHLRQCLAQRDPQVAQTMRILYGGSVKPDNAAELFAENDIDGGLIGGAALDAQQFAAICTAAE